MYLRPALSAAIAVVPAPQKGSRIKSPLYEYSSMRRLGSSMGNGAGCPIFYADSGWIRHVSNVQAKKSSFVIVSI